MVEKKPAAGTVKRVKKENEKQVQKLGANETEASLPASWPIKGPAQRPPNSSYLVGFLVVTVGAFATRFWHLNEPGEVVFDEVHFGKFASYYLRGTYFFDLHPPFAKIMIAMIGKLVGYDGEFLFDNIGLSYKTAGAPFVAYRAWSALLGSLCIPLVYATLWECGLSVASCVMGASLILFDTAEIAETRLILLDSTLLVSIAASIYAYVKFSKCRHVPFSVRWWTWLLSTGVALSCVISTKYVGVFTFLMIGIAVIADLWRLLDLRTGLTIRQWASHFIARGFALILVPFTIYLFWFWLHFHLLPNSGPGDGFMSAKFKETLGENPAVIGAMDIHFYDTITLRSRLGSFFLHSHEAQYPLRYDDGRISSQGQQVTGYSTVDPNNEWQILPEGDILESERGYPMPILGSQMIRLRHVASNSYLLTHDVASPSFPTNEEFTTVSEEVALGDRRGETLFTLNILEDPDSRARTGLTKFRLEHVNTKVAMWMSDKLLPDWGFEQVEINGVKELKKPGTEWYFDDVVGIVDREARKTSVKKDGDKSALGFFSKWLELQLAMFRSNNNLKDTHPYQSTPFSWPFLFKGVSFWTHNESKSQIYFIGNYFSYFFELLAFLILVFLALSQQVFALRQSPLVSDYAVNKLYRTVMWFFIGWICHYAPFFLMGRQLFLHHYMPAHMIGALVAAGVTDFFFCEFERPSDGRSKLATTIASVLVSLGCAATFKFLAPLTYGLPLTVEQVRARQIFDSILHFNK